jgi:hypothetical protein
MRPWLSVLMPTYNGEAYLPHGLESLLEGDPCGIEVIAVDDGSQDGTLAILQEYQRRLNLRVERPPRTGNWVENTNLALRLAHSEHACLLHQDDCWLPGRLGFLRERLASQPATGWLLHPSIYLDPAGRQIGTWRCPLRGGPVAPQELLERLIVQNFVSLPAPVFPRRWAQDVGGLDPRLMYTADWDFWLKLARALPACYVRAPMTGYRLHPASLTMQLSQHAGAFRAQLECVLGRHLEGVLRLSRTPARVTQLARFSVEVNVALASAVHGTPRVPAALLGQALALGPTGLGRFVGASRILERVLARLRVRMRQQPAGSGPAPANGGSSAPSVLRDGLG